MNRLVDAIPPPVHIVDIEHKLIDRPVDVAGHLVRRSCRPRPARHQTVQLWKVRLRDRLTPIYQSGDALQIVAKSLEIVPRYDLLVHVIEQLTPSILIDYLAGALERVHQVPVPVVQIDADVLAKVGDAMLQLQIGRAIIARYLNGGLL